MTKPQANQLITFLTTDKFDETKSFLEDILEFPLTLDQAHCRIYKISPGAFVGICRCDEPMPEAKRVTISIQTHDVDGWYQKITREGLATDGTPRWNERYGIYHFFTWDPNGFSYEFQEFRIEGWDPSA